MNDWYDNEIFVPGHPGMYLCKVRRFPNPIAKQRLVKFENGWHVGKWERVIKWKEV